MDYVSFMRKVDGRPEKAESKVDTSGFYYSNDYPPSVESIQLALSGSRSTLSHSFTWGNTPQGHVHWYSIYSGNVQLTIADVLYLEWLIEEYS